MASPAQLTQVVSDVTGVPLATVVDIDRKLVKDGLRTKGGRGLNAARMQPLDAARLLTAILASPQANEAAATSARYSQTCTDACRSSESGFGATGLDDLAALPARHSFVDALATLISSATHGSLATLQAGMDQHWQPSIEIFAFTRATRGRIRIAGLHNGLTASVEYGAAGRSRVGAADHATGDLEQSRRITELTIFSIAELLRQESRRDRA
jgi:hypothetical protein